MQSKSLDVSASPRGKSSSRFHRARPAEATLVRAGLDEALVEDADRADFTGEDRPEGANIEIAAVDPMIFCARLWCVCTGQTFDADQTVNNPEFLGFLSRKGLDTPRITPLFDIEFYHEQVSWQLEPKNYILHYCECALETSIQPHILFDRDYLLSQSGMDEFDRPPLLYFLERGDHSLSPHPLFECDVYAGAVGAEFLAGEHPIVAFIERWAQKPAPFSSFFSHKYYCLHEPVVRYSMLNPLMHFLYMPPARRKDPNPMFHRGWYGATLPAEVIGHTEPLIHYIRHGLPMGLMPNPFAREELRADSLGLSALVDALRRYLSFPKQLSAV